MNDIEPKIKPLFRDLKKLRIGNYLASTEFDRHAIKYGLEGIWNDAIDAFSKENRVITVGFDTTPYDREDALRILMNWTIRSSQSDFNTIIFIILSGFIYWSNQKLDFKNIFVDLELAGLPVSKVDELNDAYKERNKVFSDIEMSEKTKKVLVPVKKLTGHIEFIESNKTAWIDQISKGDIQSVLDEVKNFAQKINNIALTKKVINLSSRWYRIRDQNNSGTLKIEDKELIINQINEALIDLVLSLE